MNVHDENTDGGDGLGAALGHAALGLDAPRPEEMYSRAVVRGRQIKRRRVIGATLSSTLGLGAAVAMAVVLIPGQAGPARVAAAAGGQSASSSPTPAPGPSVSPSSGAIPPLPGGGNTLGPTASLSAPAFTGPTTSALSSETLAHFLNALPASADPLQDPAHGGAPSSWGPAVNAMSGDSYVGGSVDLKSPSSTGWSGVSFNLNEGVQISTCKEAEAGSTTDTCTVSKVGGGTLILDKTWHNPADPNNNPIWQYFWYSPSGYEVDLSIGDVSVSDFALTEQQTVAVLTEGFWAEVAGQLGAPVCPGGTMTQVVSSTPGPLAGMEYKCSTTGKIYS
jgi:hypothetical protein